MKLQFAKEPGEDRTVEESVENDVLKKTKKYTFLSFESSLAKLSLGFVNVCLLCLASFCSSLILIFMRKAVMLVPTNKVTRGQQ